MKVIGGSFGLDGKVEAGAENITINGKLIHRDRITGMSGDQSKARSFSVTSLVAGLVVLVPVAWVIAGPLGGFVMTLVTVAGSFYRKRSRVVSVSLDDGKTAVIECGKKDAERLFSLAPH